MGFFFFSLFPIIFSFCWDHFMMQGKDTASHLGFSGSPETEPGWEWGPRVSWAAPGRGMWWEQETQVTHELLACFFLKEILLCPPVESCILRASPFCHITVAHTVRNLPGTSLPTPIRRKGLLKCLVSDAVISNGHPQRIVKWRSWEKLTFSFLSFLSVLSSEWWKRGPAFTGHPLWLGPAGNLVVSC